MSSRSDKSPVYRLYGVIVHLDVMNAAFSGHYVCYIRNNQNKWFKIDDSTVCYHILLLYILFNMKAILGRFLCQSFNFLLYLRVFNVPLCIIFTTPATMEALTVSRGWECE